MFFHCFEISVGFVGANDTPRLSRCRHFHVNAQPMTTQ
jgi:hypothetical protein